PAADQAVLRALAKSPDERFPDMAAFGKALQAALHQMPGWQEANLGPVVEYVLGGGSTIREAAEKAALAPTHVVVTPRSQPRAQPPANAPLPQPSLVADAASDTQRLPPSDPTRVRTAAHGRGLAVTPPPGAAQAADTL